MVDIECLLCRCNLDTCSVSPASGPLLRQVVSPELRRLCANENKCPYKPPWPFGGRFVPRTLRLRACSSSCSCLVVRRGVGRHQPSPVLTCVFGWLFSEGWFLGWCPSRDPNPLGAVSPPPRPSVCLSSWPGAGPTGSSLPFCPLLSAYPLISAHICPRTPRTGWPPGSTLGPADPAFLWESLPRFSLHVL